MDRNPSQSNLSKNKEFIGSCETGLGTGTSVTLAGLSWSFPVASPCAVSQFMPLMSFLDGIMAPAGCGDTGMTRDLWLP